MNYPGQIETFFITVVTGMFLGGLFDFYRIMRGLFKPRRVFTSLADLLYWLLATVIVFVALLLGNWGEIRFYVFCGLLVGLLLYFRFFSRQVIRLLVGVIRLAAKAFRAVKVIVDHTLFRPAVFLLRLVLRPLRWIRKKLKFRPPPPDEIIPPQ
ncbi:MAG: spore cortex biosynthesis protein YabQ [Negativicutes bacterium]|nr:spore cortex biosynthesis protein YabQ [Negativicutes bacterium]